MGPALPAGDGRAIHGLTVSAGGMEFARVSDGLAAPAQGTPMFVFYSNRLGCAGSILLSLVGTALLVLVIWLLNR